MAAPIIDPTHEDPIAAAGSNVIGGPMGRFALRGRNWWLPVRVLMAMTAAAYMLGYLLDLSCRSSGWVSPQNYEHLCYSDIVPLFGGRGFDQAAFPYLNTPVGQNPLEYPVLTGVFMYLASLVTHALTSLFPELPGGRTFFDVNVVGLFIPLLVAVVALALTVRRRPWDAAMLALAPSVILAATINWDLLPLGFLGVALLLWARSRPLASGILLGLAIASKFYPVVLLGAFLVLTVRTGRWRAFGSLLGGTAIAWLVVNVPLMLADFDGWSFFYRFSSERGEDFGSIWMAMRQLGLPGVPAEQLNMLAMGLLVVLCAGIAGLTLATERRPRLASVMFLVVAAFVLTNKVYSPQYALWLVPLAVMARPRWRDFLIWQAGQLVYFAAIWWFLVGYGNTENKGLTPQWYGAAILVHVVFTLWFSGMVIRDMVRPEHDPIRTDGFAEDADDPAGGVFDGAPDVVTVRRG